MRNMPYKPKEGRMINKKPISITDNNSLLVITRFRFGQKYSKELKINN